MAGPLGKKTSGSKKHVKKPKNSRAERSFSAKFAKAIPEETDFTFNEDDVEDDMDELDFKMEETRKGDLQEEEEEEEEEEEGDKRLAEPAKDAVYDVEGLRAKLADICWPQNAEWIHKLSVDFDPGEEIDVNDDLVRELAFYTQALEGTRQAFEKLQSMGIPFLRPPDYYAEMVKSDAHMVKVKGKLLVEKKKLEEAEERRKAREAKRIAKEVQAQKLKERAKQKKEDIESVKKWRKQRQRSGFAGGNDDINFDDDGGERTPFQRSKKLRPGVSAGDRLGGHGRKGKVIPGKNREKRNEKFGYGGKKRMRKQNTAETTNDFRGFNRGDNKKGKKQRRQ